MVTLEQPKHNRQNRGMQYLNTRNYLVKFTAQVYFVLRRNFKYKSPDLTHFFCCVIVPRIVRITLIMWTTWIINLKKTEGLYVQLAQQMADDPF